MKKVIFINDNDRVRNLIVWGLSNKGYQAVGFTDFESSKDFMQNNPDCHVVIICDNHGAGEVDDVEAVRRMRQAMGDDLVILFVTDMVAFNALKSKSEDNRSRDALNAGADRAFDGVDITLFLAYMNALSRRDEKQFRAERIRFKGANSVNLVVDTGSRQIEVQGKSVDLTAKEYDLMLYLMINQGRVLERQQILSHVWGREYAEESNVIEVYIRYLRMKTEKGGLPRHIRTVRGVGYALLP